jgi:trypsin
MENRIIGGDQVGDISEYPFIASLMTTRGRHRCGGSVLSKHVVITAGHCGYNFQASLMQVVVGRVDLSDTASGVVLG